MTLIGTNKTFNHKGHKETRRRKKQNLARRRGEQPRREVEKARVDRKGENHRRGRRCHTSMVGRETSRGQLCETRIGTSKAKSHRRGRLCYTSVVGRKKSALPRPVIRDRQCEHRFAALSIRAVGELQHAAVGFCDLAAQDQTDAAAAVLGGEEWNKKIVAVEQAGALVADEDFNAARVGAPAHFHGAGMFERGIKRGVDGVADQVDQYLLNLVRVGINGDGRAVERGGRKGGAPAMPRAAPWGRYRYGSA